MVEWIGRSNLVDEELTKIDSTYCSNTLKLGDTIVSVGDKKMKNESNENVFGDELAIIMIAIIQGLRKHGKVAVVSEIRKIAREELNSTKEGKKILKLYQNNPESFNNQIRFVLVMMKYGNVINYEACKIKLIEKSDLIEGTNNAKNLVNDYIYNSERIWAVRPGNKGQVENEAYLDGYALIGWGRLGNLSKILSKQLSEKKFKEAIGSELKKFYKYKDWLPNTISNNVNQIYNFTKIIQKNDICVLPIKKYRNPEPAIVIGKFIGDYEYLPIYPELGRHGRTVKWYSRIIPKKDLPKGLFDSRNSKTIFEITNSNIKKWVRNNLYCPMDLTSDNIPEDLFPEDMSYREAIEKVIDDYDKNDEDKFLEEWGREESTLHWVLSTKPNRKYTKYVSKVVADAATRKNRNEDRKITRGGWGGYSNACTVLYKAGYVIVDKDGVPSTKNGNSNKTEKRVNSRKKIYDLERIISVIKNYYIEPSKEQKIKSITINTTELKNIYGLNNSKEIRDILFKLDGMIHGIKLMNQPKINENEFTYGLYLDPEYSDESEPTEYEPYSIDSFEKDCFIERKELDRFLKRLKTKKSIIFVGPPGTGKTWLAKRLAFALIGFKDERKVLVKQFHPTFYYEDFVRGWRPTGKGKLKLIDGSFMKLIEIAKKDTSSKYVAVIEEINRGNPTQIFGEMLTLLEADKRSVESSIELTYTRKGEQIYIPPNLYIVGTMNIADRSIAPMDLALRRRFATFNLEPNLEDSWYNWVKGNFDIDDELLTTIRKRLIELNDSIKSDDNLGSRYKIGHSFVTPDPDMETPIENWNEWFRDVVETEIKPVLLDYWSLEPQKAETEIEKLLSGID